MNSDIEILENIMRPYFDKKEEVENSPIAKENEIVDSNSKIQELKRERIERRKALELELENLRVRNTIAIKDFKEKKEIEIENYINDTINSNSNFFTSYGSMLRKDLEQEYDKKLENMKNDFEMQEKQILDEIAALKSVSDDERNEKQNLDYLNKKSDFSRVDLRELVEIKDKLRKQLFAERKRLNAKLDTLKPEQKLYEETASKLKQQQLKFNEVMNKLSEFKYEYNDQNQVINSDEWRELYQQSILISEKVTELTQILSEKMNLIQELDNINKALFMLDEYLKLTELTKEETSAVMMSMTPWEKEEYDRRKSLLKTVSNVLGEVEPELHPISQPDQTKEETPVAEELQTVSDSEGTSLNEDMITREDPIVSKYDIEDGKVVVNTKIDLLKAIFNDIIDLARTMRSVRLNPSKEKLGQDEYYVSTSSGKDEEYKESGTVNLYSEHKKVMELPNGEYLNYSDFNDALDNYYAKNKGQSYVVKETKKEYKITKGTIVKFKASLKHCSAIKLVKDKKVSKLDITRILGKPKAEMLFRANDIGTIYGNKSMPEGDYINRNELIAKFNNLFTTKKLDWLRNMSSVLKSEQNVQVNEEETKVK